MSCGQMGGEGEVELNSTYSLPQQLMELIYYLHSPAALHAVTAE